MHEENDTYVHEGELFSHKEWNHDICKKTDEDYIKTRHKESLIFSHMCNL